MSLLVGCSEIQPVAFGECGNHIVEDGEDCDGGSRCSEACHIPCDAQTACPAGSGCAAEAGFCRTPSGNFQAQSLVAESFQQLVASDFDGDQRDDLLAVSDAGLSTVSFFDAAGVVVRSVSLPVARSAAVGDITADGLPDVLLGGGAATVFRSTKTRGFSPLIGALRKVESGAKLLTVDIDCDGQKDFLLLGGDGAQGGGALSRVLPSGELASLGHVDTTAQELTLMEMSQGSESGDERYRLELTASASYEATTGSRCGMLALPVVDQAAVDVWAAPFGVLTKLSRVTYASAGEAPDLQSLATRLLFTDLNDDARPDLLITSFNEQWASYGLGDGTFDSHSSPTSFADSLANSIAFGSEVLAVGELDTQPGVDLFPWDFAPDAQFYWAARSVDLSGDGLMDVAAVGDLRRVDLFRGHPTGLVSRLSIPLSGVPRIEDTGDFDGDGAPDLLLSQAPSPTSPLQVATILFSPVKTELSQATDLVTFERVEQLAAANLPEAFAAPDACTDIAALFTNETHHLRLGFLTGGTDRLLRSPLPKAPVADDTFETSSPVIGRFRSGMGSQMVLLTATTPVTGPPQQGDEPSSLRVDLLSSDSGGVAVASSSQSMTGGDFETSARPAAIDLDGDGLDEIYVPGRMGLLRVAMVGERFQANMLLESELFMAVSVADVDADGVPDLVATGPSGLRVAFGGRGTVAFDLNLEIKGVDWTYGTSAALLNLDADGALELALAEPSYETETGEIEGGWLRLYDVSWSNGANLLVRQLDGVETSNLVAGDFNGDGVDDLVGSYEQMGMWLGVPR